MLFLYTLPYPMRNMKLWPTHTLTFRDTLDNYSQELKKVAESLVGLMAKNLGLSPEKLTDICKDGLQAMRTTMPLRRQGVGHLSTFRCHTPNTASPNQSSGGFTDQEKWQMACC